MSAASWRHSSLMQPLLKASTLLDGVAARGVGVAERAQRLDKDCLERPVYSAVYVNKLDEVAVEHRLLLERLPEFLRQHRLAGIVRYREIVQEISLVRIDSETEVLFLPQRF